MKNLFLLSIICYTVFSCSESTSPEPVVEKETAASKLLKFRLLTKNNGTPPSLPEPPALNDSIRDTTDPWQNANFGDLAYILIKPSPDPSYDIFKFEGLELPYESSFRKHIRLNTSSYREDLSWYIDLSVYDNNVDPNLLNWLWGWYYVDTEITPPYYEQLDKYNLNIELVSSSFEDTSTVHAYAIQVVYCPTSDQPGTSTDKTFYYTYKGKGTPNFVNGGYLELVGIKITESGVELENIGDNSYKTNVFSYTPSGYYSKTPATSPI